MNNETIIRQKLDLTGIIRIMEQAISNYYKGDL